MVAAGTTEPEATEPVFRGWISYDGECGFCRNLARRFERGFDRRGFRFTPFVAQDAQPSEMRVHTTDGRDLGGSDALVFLSSRVWWGTPLFLFSKLPGAKSLLHRLYREIAARRSSDTGSCQRSRNQ